MAIRCGSAGAYLSDAWGWASSPELCWALSGWAISGYGLAGGAFAGSFLSGKARRAARPLYGQASLNQLRMMVIAIGSEMLVFALLGASGLFASLPAAEVWDICFGIVGAHFLIMRFSHGPMMLRLAGAVLGWLALGITLHLSPFALALGDGAIKLAIGAWMLWPLLRPAETANTHSLPDPVA